jgi:hypothetical protein
MCNNGTQDPTVGSVVKHWDMMSHCLATMETKVIVGTCCTTMVNKYDQSAMKI